MTFQEPPLPESVALVAAVIGRDAALRLAGALAPAPTKPWLAPLYVPTPARLQPDHDLVAILGWQTALRLCRGLGGEMMTISKCRGLERAHRNRRIWELRGEGCSAAEIADQLDLKADTVRKILQLGAGGKPPMETAG